MSRGLTSLEQFAKKHAVDQYPLTADDSLPTPEPLKLESSLLEGISVLVVEDNLTIQLLTKKMFESKGASVVTASNGDEGLQKTKALL